MMADHDERSDVWETVGVKGRTAVASVPVRGRGRGGFRGGRGRGGGTPPGETHESHADARDKQHPQRWRHEAARLREEARAEHEDAEAANKAGGVIRELCGF